MDWVMSYRVRFISSHFVSEQGLLACLLALLPCFLAGLLASCCTTQQVCHHHRPRHRHCKYVLVAWGPRSKVVYYVTQCPKWGPQVFLWRMTWRITFVAHYLRGALSMWQEWGWIRILRETGRWDHGEAGEQGGEVVGIKVRWWDG